ncbi:hypothetical protein GJ496_010583 [Pomphorhynchus laevis]|nr:hypothetical protein GJ496_010583 [Pomphorhynchus laevis]
MNYDKEKLVDCIDDRFACHVLCDCLQLPNFEASNLLRKSTMRAEEFRVPCDFKQPVKVTFTFKYPISPKRIILQFIKGRYACKGIKIQVQTSNKNKRHNYFKCIYLQDDSKDLDLSEGNDFRPQTKVVAIRLVLFAGAKCIRLFSVFVSDELYLNALVNDNRLKYNDQYAVSEEPETDERFIDPITLLNMKTPVKLSSGHTVDLSTFERLVEESRKMNKKPINPFTGLQIDLAKDWPILNEDILSLLNQIKWQS